jgi:PAS domain S-box-containing protein
LHVTTLVAHDTSLGKMFARYAIAVVSVSASFLLRAALIRLFGQQLPFFMLCYPAIMLSALLGGLGPGLLATVLGVLGTEYFVMLPVESFSIADPAQASALVLFGTTGVFISMFTGRYRRSQRIIAADKDEQIQRRSEETQRQASEYRQSAFDAAGMGSWEFCLASGTIVGDANCRRLFGRQDETLSVEAFQNCIHPQDRAMVQGLLELSMAGVEGVLWGPEYRIVWPDGSIHWIATYGQAYTNVERKIDRLVGVSMEITERKRAEEQLRVSETKLNEAQRMAHIGSWTYRPPDVHTWSDEMYELFKLERDVPLTNDSASSVMHPEDQGNKGRLMTALESGAVELRSEYRVIWPNSQIRWMTTVAKIRREADGQVIEAVGTVQDITDRKRVEERLRASEAQLKEAQHIAHVGNWIYRPPATFIWSDEMYELFKLQRGVPVTYDSALSVIHPDDRAAIYEGEFKTALESGGSDVHSEFRVIWPDSRIRWMSSIGRIRRDADRRAIEAVGTMQDITESKQAEAALRKSEQEYRLLFEQIPDGIFITDAKGQFTDVNAAGVELIGYAPDEFCNLTIPEILPTEEAERLPAVLGSFASGTVTNLEMQHKRKDGSIFDGSVSGRQLSDGRIVAIVRDISQQKQAAADKKKLLDAVQHERDTLSALISAMRDEVWLIDAEQRVALANPTALSTFGSKFVPGTPIEEIGQGLEFRRPDGSLRPIEDSPPLRALKGEVIRSEEEILRYFETGELRHRELNAVPIRDAAGTIIGSLVVVHDITKRKNNEAHIARLSRVHSVLSEINQTIIRVRDSQMMLAAACRIAVEKGKFRMAWIGMIDSATQTLQPMESSGFVNGYLTRIKIDFHDTTPLGPSEQCARFGKHAICNDIEHELLRPWKNDALKNGYRSVAAFPLRRDGEVVGVFSLYATETAFFDEAEVQLLDGLAADISFALEVNRSEEDRKKKEEELQWRTAFFEAQVDSALDGVLVVDNQGKKILQNARLIEMLKIPASVYESSDDARQRAFVKALVKAPGQFEEKVQYLYSHPNEVSLDEIELIDGRILERYSSPVRGKSREHYGRIWTFRDMTARLRLEEQFRQSQKMEAVGQLTGGIAHDFNNLLAVIIGNLDLLECQIKDNEAAVKRVHTARNASLRGAEVTRRLLAFARQQDLKPTALDLDTVIETVLALAAPALGPTIQVITRLHPSIPPVFVDASGLQNALLNLFVNARDAMANGGKLTVTSELRILESGQFLGTSNELAPGRYALVTVSDTGHGMTKETARKVFEPFFTTKSHGTGLGLAMVYGFFKQSGGAVRISSELGNGTTFSFFLPTVAGAAHLSSATPVQARSPSVTTGTILIVDDESYLLEIASTCLTDLGYSVLTAKDGVSAIQVLAERNDIGLLLTDVIMPGGMNGVELARRATEINRQIRIIYCSGFPADALREKELSLAEGPLLRKPYQRSELVGIVGKVLAEAITMPKVGKSTSNEAS